MHISTHTLGETIRNYHFCKTKKGQIQHTLAFGPEFNRLRILRLKEVFKQFHIKETGPGSLSDLPKVIESSKLGSQ